MTTTKRTDPHSPSNLIPQDYVFMGFSPSWTIIRDFGGRPERDCHDEIVAYLNEDEDDLLTDEQEEYIIANQFNGNAINKGGCDCCGSYPSAVAYFKHNPTGEVITVGRTCSDKISEGAFERAERKSVSEIARRKRASVKAKGEAFIDSHDGLRSVLESGKNEILDDMLGKVHVYGSLSEKQVAFAFRLFAQCIEREEKQARRLEALNGSTLDCSQRITVTGTVKTTKFQDSDYGGSMKMLVELDNGFKVWGTIPTTNVEATDYYDLNSHNLLHYTDATDEQKAVWQKRMDDCKAEMFDVNDTIQFTARFEMSKDDATFAWFKRPTKLTKKTK